MKTDVFEKLETLKLALDGNLLFLKASKSTAELQHPPSSLTERRGVGGKGRRGVCPVLFGATSLRLPESHCKSFAFASPGFDTLEQ